MEDTIVTHPLEEDMREMVEEMKSPFNRWVTGEEKEHPPTDNECALHYIENDGVKHFRETHKIAV